MSCSILETTHSIFFFFIYRRWLVLCTPLVWGEDGIVTGKGTGTDSDLASLWIVHLCTSAWGVALHFYCNSESQTAVNLFADFIWFSEYFPSLKILTYFSTPGPSLALLFCIRLDFYFCIPTQDPPEIDFIFPLSLIQSVIIKIDNISTGGLEGFWELWWAKHR